MGSLQTVFVDGSSRKDEREWTGRTECNRAVNFAAPGSLVGQLVAVQITEARSHSLRGRLHLRAA